MTQAQWEAQAVTRLAEAKTKRDQAYTAWEASPSQDKWMTYCHWQTEANHFAWAEV